MFPEWTWILGFWIGAAIGSFLNVVVYRVPRGLSIAQPEHSFCPTCKARLTVPDLIPLLSWLFLRGKCRHCGSKIAGRYFVVELINASLWGAIWYQQLVLAYDPAAAIAYALFGSALVAAIFTDLQFYIIPDEVNAFMLIVGLGLNVATIVQHRGHQAWMWGMPSSIAGALVGVGILWGIAFFGRVLFRKDAMGHGDIKMARGVGAVLLPLSAGLSFGIAVALGAVLGIVQVIARKVLSSSKEPEDEEDADEDEGPESIGSLLKCGVGYVFCIDIIGLFVPSLYERWFGENPRCTEQLEEEPRVELTMIPFGPYLAAGALVAMLAREPLQRMVEAYLRSMTGS